MEQKLIGREKEKTLLKECYESGRAEFVAIYGRRRIGKTFLVKKFFNEKFAFYSTGIYEGTKSTQLKYFNKMINTYSDGIFYSEPKDWFEAFDQLKSLLTMKPKDQRQVVFLDELPWMDTQKSGFVMALDLFWNSWASTRDNLMLIVCGSATTWMTSKLVANKGGLHNRLTRRIHLSPFTLKETEEYLKDMGIAWERPQITDCYMTIGGTPYYLSKLRRGRSVAQNIDELFFAEDVELRSEYDFLFRSLFNDSSLYRNVVETLCAKAKGMTRQEICNSLKLEKGGKLTEVLRNLQKCDFIRKYFCIGKKERDAIYQMTDLYSLFYNRFVAGITEPDENTWSSMTDNPARQAWCGYAYEQVCLHHIPQIKKALGINGVLTNVGAWTGKDEEGSGQIDLVIERRDDVINLCEIKYSNKEYAITKDYAQKLIDRMELFRRVTKTKKALHLTMITSLGLKHNNNSECVQSEITLNDLFS